MDINVQSNVAPDLIALLLEEYLKAMREHESEGADKAELSAGAEQFCEFATAYLTDNRPRNSYPADDNIGVILSSGRRVLISPGSDLIHGTMAPIAGKSVDDTPGKLGSVGYADQGAVPISGLARKPKGAIDYSAADYGMNRPAKDGKPQYVDKSATGTNKIYDPETARKHRTAATIDDPLNR